MGGHAVVVEGSGALAEELRGRALETQRRTVVVVACIDPRPTAFEAITEETFEAAWEAPMQQAIDAFRRAHDSGVERIIAVVPTIGMSGALHNAAGAATSEALRALVKSAARQWGADGIAVNCVAVAPALFGIGSDQIGAVSIAPPAARTAPETADVAAVIRLLGSDDADPVTGGTFVVDGGVWMAT